MFKSRTPGIAKHTLKNADNLGTNIGFSGGVGKFERVESDWELGVCWIEINNVFNAVWWNETEVVNGKISVWIDNTITLIVKNVR